MRRERGTPQAVQRLVSSTAALDGRTVPIWMEEEGGSSGKTVIDHYTRKVLSGYTFRGIRSTGDKVTRAAPVSSQAEAGNIKLLRGNWLLPFLDEVGAFPTPGVHDDQVDALSGALAMLSSRNTAIPTFGALTRQTQ
ncbi:MAG: phage terminase large subunit [Actinomycetota bacterium]